MLAVCGISDNYTLLAEMGYVIMSVLITLVIYTAILVAYRKIRERLKKHLA